jgi:hypothetical protein
MEVIITAAATIARIIQIAQIVLQLAAAAVQAVAVVHRHRLAARLLSGDFKKPLLTFPHGKSYFIH